MKLKVIACAIMEAEVREAAALSPHEIDMTFIDLKDCHEKVEQGRKVLQKAVEAEQRREWDAILLGYGLCGKVLKGVKACDIPLVVPRAHDCLTVFFGSRQKYTEYFMANPGTYYLSEGWIKHAAAEGGDLTAQMQMGELTVDYDALVEQYGEENAKFVAETLGAWQNHYSRACVITRENQDAEPLIRQAESLCAGRGWEVVQVEGSNSLVTDWLNGNWEAQSFLTVPPGYVIEESFGGDVMEARKTE